MSDQDYGWVTLAFFLIVVAAEFLHAFFKGYGEEPHDD